MDRLQKERFCSVLITIALMGIIVALCFVLCGCFSLMTDADWARFEQNAKANGWTEERIAEFKAEAIEREDAAVEATQAIIHTAIDAIPIPVDKAPWKDLADYGLYAVLGLGGAEVMRRKVKNSQPGKLFGPINGARDGLCGPSGAGDIGFKA